jgi:ABC-type Fe3+ transport system permease subunit
VGAARTLDTILGMRLTAGMLARVLNRRPHPPSRPIALLCVCAALALAIGGIVPVVALSAAGEAGSGAFNELSERAQQQETTTTETAATTPKESTSNSKTVVMLALVAAVLVLVAIAFVIVRDARKRSIARDGPVGEPRPARDPAVQMRKRRAKAKAARQQRKRNR